MRRIIENTIGTIECVISRYNEHLNWILGLPHYISKIYIYNKGENENYFKDIEITDELRAKLIFIKLSNVGRIDHTIVYHILNNWDSLPEHLIFLPGSSVMCLQKGRYLMSLKRNLQKLKTKHHGFFASRSFKVSPDYNFSRDSYQAEGYCNRNENPFIKSEYQDFKTWKIAIIDDIPLKYMQYRGMFAVSKQNILHIDKKIYLSLLQSLSVGDNIENGHFAERIWAHLFKQYSDFNNSIN